MTIAAIIINGRHGGILFMAEYRPTIKIPIEKESKYCKIANERLSQEVLF